MRTVSHILWKIKNRYFFRGLKVSKSRKQFMVSSICLSSKSYYINLRLVIELLSNLIIIVGKWLAKRKLTKSDLWIATDFRNNLRIMKVSKKLKSLCHNNVLWCADPLNILNTNQKQIFVFLQRSSNLRGILKKK